MSNTPPAYQPQWTKGNQKDTLAIYNLNRETFNLLRDYEQLAATMFEWEGLEDIQITQRYMESLFFWNNCIGIVKAEKDKTIDYPLVLGAKATKLNVYAEIYTWTPNPTNHTTLEIGVVKEYYAKKHPCIKLTEQTVAEGIIDECQWQASAYISANQNVLAMRMPYVIKGADSAMETKFLFDNVVDGRGLIPVVDSKNANIIEVLDINHTSFLSDLTGYMEFLHTKILGKLGIDALGTQKASGITTEEATLILAQIRGIREVNLERREKVCDMINEHIDGANVSVKIRDIYLDKVEEDVQRFKPNEDNIATTNSNIEGGVE